MRKRPAGGLGPRDRAGDAGEEPALGFSEPGSNPILTQPAGHLVSETPSVTWVCDSRHVPG